MRISGPFKDVAKAGQPKPWYLRYATPKLNPDGTTVLAPDGKPVLQRHRPYYESKDKAKADIPRIQAQYASAGGGDFLFNRAAAAEFEEARKIVGDLSLVEVAKFWRLHHPVEETKSVADLVQRFLAVRRALLDPRTPESPKRPKRSLGRHYNDLESRCTAFAKTAFGARYPKTITREEILSYLVKLPHAPRTVLNHKRCLCTFFGWLREEGRIDKNPAEGIKKRALPKIAAKEIQFLSLDEVSRYLRAAERYAPELVAHEVVQLFAGVRADDEMEDFRAEFVHPETKEIVLPSEVTKTEKREVIGSDQVEEVFWLWWQVYGSKSGLLRPPNFGPRWDRLRILASIKDQTEADRLARLPIKTLRKHAKTKTALASWPFNARRRSFCTYHVAKHQSAAKTALILRHRGSASTLHDSYRGLGVTQEQGRAYFAVLPLKVPRPITPEWAPRGIVRIQAERSAANHLGV